MNIKNKVLKVIVFFIIGILIFQILTYIFVPKWINSLDSPPSRIKSYYKEKKNSIDVLMVGNSDLSEGYSPILVWKNYGITSYNLGTQKQSIGFSYYMIKEAIKYQDIKMIVMDMDSAFTAPKVPETRSRQFFDNIRLGKEKFEAINDSKLKIEDKDRLSYFFPLLRFHTRWNELKEEDFKKSLEDEYQKLSYKGGVVITDVEPYVYDKNYMKERNKKVEMNEINLYYMNKIFELCREKNIKLLCIEIPSATNGVDKKNNNSPFYNWTLAKSKYVDELTKKYGVEFIDFNLPENIEKINFDWSKDSSDGGNHLNIYGAEKVSEYIGKVLSEKYNLKDHRNDNEIALNWNETEKKYEDRKIELHIDN